MQALILAGGLGTRLRSIVDDRPKGMADIEDKPFLAHQIAFLKAQGVTHVVLCVGYLHDHVMSYFGNGEAWGVRIDYSIEATPLGTGGALKHAQHFVEDTFLVLNGDSFFDVDLQHLMQFHEEQKVAQKGSVGTLALTRVPDASRYGSVTLDAKDRVVKFAEKSALPMNSSGLINAGVYVLEPEILNLIPSDEKVSLERAIFPSFLQGEAQLNGFESNGFFIDIGTPEGYYRFCGYVQGKQSDRVMVF